MQLDLDTAFLFIGLFNGSVVGALLLYKPTNRLANTILVSFIFCLVCRILTYVLGSTGIYDPHNWLYVSPVELSLAYGPLIYLYLRALTQSKLPDSWWWHLLPALIQVIYYFTLMMMPEVKLIDWVVSHHLHTVVYLETLLVLVSMSCYISISWFWFFRYQNWLGVHTSNKENYRLPWIKSFLAVSSLSIMVVIVFLVMQLWVEFDYNSHFLLFATQSLLLLYLALESWRNSALVVPLMPDSREYEEVLQGSEVAGEADKQLAKQWLQQLKHQQWWRDPDLTLASLSKRLGTNTSKLSAVFNKGFNENFNSVINRLRVEWVCEQIEQGVIDGELLKVALTAGFNSKNSFNRSFKRFTGMTPTQYREKSRVKS